MNHTTSPQPNTAPAEIVVLVERFRQQSPAYRAGRYNETQLRRDFLDPLFEALGWDVSNRKNYSERFREVIHEVSVEVGGQARAADYAFQSGGGVLFFLEAKKPSINIETDPEPAFQIRRYAWSAKLPVSLLSDFEHLAVYDTRVKPVQGDPAHIGRVRLYHYSDYVEKWDEIHGLLSYQAVHQGSLERLVENIKAQRGTADVDDDFLEKMERWRELLARNIALRNPGLNTREINRAVQMTIDRIIFLRICEDRGIEPENALRDATDGIDVYGDLLTLFRQADRKYNSGLFHFNPEKGRPTYPDTLTPAIRIDDKPLKDVLADLYYPRSPYAFKYIPADILGQVYERFLGKVIRLTAGHQAKVEEKPEVRKAGGVYYTPTYIVEYIVRNTLGELLKERDPESLERAPLRVLDPACGSGSFLLGAYQHLLDWHLSWYAQHEPEKWARGRNPAVFQARNGWQLTMEKKKEILTRHIFGVDIDAQAVEVTKLSLLLKVVENPGQLTLMGERILPDLGENIKCGNSLIGPDYYEGRQMAIFDQEEQYRVNAFDWRAEFPQIFRDGGFDAVIGNPPYGFHQIHSVNIKPYFKKHYQASHGSYEHYFLFYEKSLSILKRYGLHGFIVPVTWLTIPSAKSLREYILNNYAINKILWLSSEVFENASVNTLVSIIGNSKPSSTTIYISDVSTKKLELTQEHIIDQSKFIGDNYNIRIFESSKDLTILEKIKSLSTPLTHFARPCSGYNPYEVGKGKSPKGGLQTKETVKTKPYHSNIKIDDSWKPEIVGRDLGRYSIHISGQRWIKYGPWLAAPRDPNNFLGRRILVQEITGGPNKRIIAAFNDGELYHSRDVIPIKFDNEILHPYYILGLINSRLMTWYHHKKNPKAQKALFPKVLVSDIQNLPIRNIDLTKNHETKQYESLIRFVESMLSLHQQLAAARLPEDKERLQRQIQATDRQIDRLVYELYGLTEEEIRIVEGEG